MRDAGVGVNPRNGGRLLAGVLIVLLLSPAITSGLLGSGQPTPVATDPERTTTDSLVVVSAQGDEVSTGDDSRIAVINPKTERIIWQTTTYSTYYDVDPLNESTLLYTAHDPNRTTYAVVHNWRSGKVIDRFVVGEGTHDVDYLGDGKYVYTDGKSHRAVVINRTSGEETWEYDFRNHYPTTAGGGDSSSYEGDYSHLNDVDREQNGSAFLLSPRNFDRVVLVNRSTKEVIWTLGEEDNHDILYEQHNPTLLTASPPTVLVADSENDRIVEYTKRGGEWELVWSYGRNLQWPRDADRLPNGNTLIIDSRYAMEVTPSREIVWRVRVPKFLYDIERIDLGDEPSGPPMKEFSDEFDRATVPEERASPASAVLALSARIYNASRWFLPWWIAPLDFWAGIAALFTIFVWANFEYRWRYGRTVRSFPTVVSSPKFRRAGLALLATFSGLTLLSSVTPSIVTDGGLRVKWWLWDPTYHTVALVGLLEATVLARRWTSGEWTDRRRSALSLVQYGLGSVLCVMGLSLFVLGSGLLPLKIQISSPPRLLGMAVTAVILGGRRLIPRDGIVRFPIGEHSASAPAIRGTALGLAGVGILSVGAIDVASAGAALGLGLLVGLDGTTSLGRDAVVFSGRGRWLVAGGLRTVQYSVRLSLAVVGAAAFFRMLGLGTIVGIGLRPELVNAPNVAVVLLLLLEIAELRPQP